MSLSKSTFGYGARFTQNQDSKRSVSKLILEKIDSKRQMELENQIESHVNFYKRVNQVFEKYQACVYEGLVDDESWKEDF